MTNHDLCVKLFIAQLVHLGADREIICEEFAFAKGKSFRFDIAIPSVKVAVEISGGAHKMRLRSDMRKRNAAQIAGWVVLEYPSSAKEDVCWGDSLKSWAEMCYRPGVPFEESGYPWVYPGPAEAWQQVKRRSSAEVME